MVRRNRDYDDFDDMDDIDYRDIDLAGDLDDGEMVDFGDDAGMPRGKKPRDLDYDDDIEGDLDHLDIEDDEDFDDLESDETDPINPVTRLTDAQTSVLIKVITASDEKVAGTDISYGRKVIAARDLLVQDGYLEYDNDLQTASVTEKGRQLLQDTGLVDDMDQPTDRGEHFIDMVNENFSLISQLNNRI
jgi:hypothetical protein